MERAGGKESVKKRYREWKGRDRVSGKIASVRYKVRKDMRAEFG